MIALLKIPTATAIEMNNLIKVMRSLKGEMPERRSIVKQAKILSEGITKIKDYIRMLEMMNSLTLEERDRVIRYGLEFIKKSMNLEERFEVIKRVQKINPKIREPFFDQLFAQPKDQMSGSDRVRLIAENAKALSKKRAMSAKIPESAAVSVVTPVPAIKVVVMKEPVEKRDPIEEILFSKKPEERPIILNYAREIAPDSIGLSGFVNLVEIIAGIEEEEEREAVAQHAKIFVKGRISLTDRIEIIKTILALEKSNRDTILAQASVLISERMSASERIKLIKTIESMKPEEKDLAIPQAQSLYSA